MTRDQKIKSMNDEIKHTSINNKSYVYRSSDVVCDLFVGDKLDMDKFCGKKPRRK